MNAPSPTVPALGDSEAVVSIGASPDPSLTPLLESLAELADDLSVPRNLRRGAQAAKQELTRARVALDVRVASAVAVLDELAGDPNLPTHGRTAIWSIMSALESLQ